jgi:DNA mismatch repair protein MutL
VQAIEALSDRVNAAIAQILTPDTLSEAAQTHRATELIKAAERPGDYLVSRQIDLNGASPELAKDTAVNLSDALPNALPSELKAIAQVHNMYILAEHTGGLCLIEQHIAHERVLYEQLQQRWQMVAVDSPIMLANLSAEQVERLGEIGLEIAAFGENLWAARTVPEPLSQRTDCADALRELSSGANLEAALVATACRTAIRNGTALSQSEMQALVNQWQQTRRSRTCPHGRPICLSLKESSLAKYFRRSWVIGKSHGI